MGRGRIVCALAAAVIAGCQPAFDSVDLVAVSTPPVEVTVRDFLVELPAGTAVVVATVPRSGNRHDYDDETVVDLVSDDPDVMDVFGRPTAREFVLVGIDAGETCLRVHIDGMVRDCIDVVVEPPAAD